MPTQLLFTRFLNAHFAGPVTALLHALHVQPAYPAGSDHECVCDGAAGVLCCCWPTSLWCGHRSSVETPGAVQHLAEMTHEFVSEQGEQIIGHGYERFTGYLTVLLLFILVAT